MQSIAISDLITATAGQAVATGNRAVTAGLTTDSRAVTPGCIFLALSGERFDGNSFAAAASTDAAAVIVSRLTGNYHPDCTVIQVPDTLVALQELALWWRGQLAPLHVVGLTGSSGKTSTKDMCLSVLSQRFNALATKGNLNNHIGTPLSILSAEKGTEAAIWEMGMNHAGELAPLCRMTQPHIGIITTIGSAHLEFLGTREAIAQEKCTVARALPADGYMIYPAADDFAATIAASTQATPLPVGGADSAVRALNVRSTAIGSSFDLHIDGVGEIRVNLPVPGAMGMNHAGELAPLCRMTQPHIGIITTIGSAHLEFLGTREAIAQEKCTVARALPADGYMIYPAADDFAATIAASTQATPLPVGGADSAVRALNVRSTAIGSSFDLHIDGVGEIRVNLPVPGAHMVSNSLLAAAAGWKLGCTLQQIADGLSAAALTKGRLGCKEVDGFTVVDDTYNANPESMKAALHTVASLRGPKRCIAVLGKMGELGEGGIAAHAEIGLCAAGLGYTAVVVVGPDCAETQALCQAAAERIPAMLVSTPAEAAAALRHIMEPGDAILFKGSRSAGMERTMYELFPTLTPTT